LDDNVWERRCRAMERRREKAEDEESGLPPAIATAASAPAAAAASSSSSSAAAAGGSEGSGEVGVLELDLLGCNEGGPLLGDSDDEDDGPPGAAGPLAQGDEEVALPAAPAERAKPQACDLDLDMFGEPEADTMEALD